MKAIFNPFFISYLHSLTLFLIIIYNAFIDNDRFIAAFEVVSKAFIVIRHSDIFGNVAYINVFGFLTCCCRLSVYIDCLVLSR
jgi:hypothetical protein